MPLRYLLPSNGPLSQGEIMENILELRPHISPEQSIDIPGSARLDPIEHKYAIVVSQDCDLEWDYSARQQATAGDKLLQHILFCDLYSEDEIRNRSNLRSDLFKRVKQNQDERYHHLKEGFVGETQQTLPELYADFKLVFSLPSDFVYLLASRGISTRRAVLPPLYIQDFVQRLHNFLARVPIPE